MSRLHFKIISFLSEPLNYSKKRQHNDLLNRLRNVNYSKTKISAKQSLNWCAFFFVFSCLLTAHSQVVSPFDIRFQTNQKGGIQMISNVALTCNASNGNCATFQNQLPPIYFQCQLPPLNFVNVEMKLNESIFRK